MTASDSTRIPPAQPTTHCQRYGPACPICAVVDEFVRSHQADTITMTGLVELLEKSDGGHHV